MLNPCRLAPVFDFCGCHWAKASETNNGRTRNAFFNCIGSHSWLVSTCFPHIVSCRAVDSQVTKRKAGVAVHLSVQSLAGQVRNSFQRWGQPGQQQGRRIPSLSSVRTRSMCCLLVSGLLTEMTQQIHSLRASGVISSHFARAAGSEMRTFRKSAGTACTAPRETALLVMDFSLSPTSQRKPRLRSYPLPLHERPSFSSTRGFAPKSQDRSWLLLHLQCSND